jgi:hypothetical protein
MDEAKKANIAAKSNHFWKKSHDSVLAFFWSRKNSGVYRRRSVWPKIVFL